MQEKLKDVDFDVVVGPESRGFIFGVPIAYNLHKPFIPIRKKGKLPCETVSVEYELEYGTATIEMHKDAIKPGQKVVIIDDLIATGGTNEAMVKMIESLGGEVVKAVFLMELAGLKGRERLEGYDVDAVITYPGKKKEKSREGGVNMSDKTTYESLDNRIAPEALTEDHTKGLAVVDGHAVKSQEDYEDPNRLYDMLIARIRKYHPSTDVSMIEKAYKLAVKAHGDQRRKSGEPYIIHPLWVAIILADLEMDKETIAAGMLHDVVEDTKFTEEDIRREFGDEVALLVDGVTKLGRLSYSSDKLEVQAENLRKMFLAMAKDIRVIIIKLADRLHNMRTLQFMTPAKQKEKAKETMDIYAPIAQRLGISKIKTELDDLALKYSRSRRCSMTW